MEDHAFSFRCFKLLSMLFVARVCVRFLYVRNETYLTSLVSVLQIFLTRFQQYWHVIVSSRFTQEVATRLFSRQRNVEAYHPSVRRRCAVMERGLRNHPCSSHGI